MPISDQYNTNTIQRVQACNTHR